MNLHTLFEKDTATKFALASLGHALQDGNANVLALLGAALSADAVQELIMGSLAEDVSAAELNAAAAGTFQKWLFVKLETASDKLHTWATFEPVITPAEVVVDVDVAAPAIVWFDNQAGTPSYVRGMLRLVVVFDTDAGATKTYAIGDSVTVTIDVSGIPVLAGVANLVKTYNVIA